MKIGLIQEKSNTPGMGSLYINYDGAANVEEVGYRGLSHLAEHLLCHHYDHLNERLQGAGLVSNAMTTDTNVVFYWSGLDEKIEEFQSELIGLINYIPTEDQFNNEKKIVMQEYEDYVSGQNFLFGNIGRAYFNYFGPIGYREDITSITYEKMLEFIKTRFSKPTQIVRIGKSKTIKSLCKKIKYSKPVTAKSFELIAKNDTFVESPSSFPASTMLGDWILLDRNKVSNRDALVVSKMFSAGLSSPMYQEIREKRGLVYYCGTTIDKIDSDRMTFIFYAGCTDATKGVVREQAKNVVDNYSEFLTKERYETIIDGIRNKTKMTNISNFGYGYLSKFFHSEDDYFTEEYLNSLTYEKILSVVEEIKVAFQNINYASNGETLDI